MSRFVPFVVSGYCYYLQCTSLFDHFEKEKEKTIGMKQTRKTSTKQQPTRRKKRIRENKSSSFGYYEQNTGNSIGLPSTISLMSPIEKSYQGANIYT